ncbi:MAG TPA: peptidoglycan DD-metalloendopeptidase family protein [Allosphingosinicella sp.]|uniref:murein hydrolase activator EnvC family protein n=1 Tax=Allosphingosinicella sp. TaxID=2823234 RepID=UPI002ED7BC27
MKRRLLLAACAAALLTGSYAAAQSVEQARREAAAAAKRSADLRRQASQANSEAARARAEAEALVADIQKTEADITAAEAQLAAIERLRTQQRARIAEKQQPLIRLTAALQTMAARPPALALARPGSIDELVRVRALIASMEPKLRARTAALRAEAAAGDRLKAEADAALKSLAASREELRSRRIALARLEESQRRRSEQLASSAFSEEDRVVAYSEEARALTERLRDRALQARLAKDLAALPGPQLPPGAQPAAAERAPPYRLPVQGRIAIGMGELSDAGVHARGTTFETVAGAPVIAPRAGRIAYAGRFRSYGEVVIIDHGGGWTSTITNLSALRVRQGDRVGAGDPLGRAGRQVTVELRLQGRPQPLTSLLT